MKYLVLIIPQPKVSTPDNLWKRLKNLTVSTFNSATTLSCVVQLTWWHETVVVVVLFALFFLSENVYDLIINTERVDTIVKLL